MAFPLRFERLASAGAAAALLASATPAGAETRGYVVSWFYPTVAAATQDKDCPGGMNTVDVRQMLAQAGIPTADIDRALAAEKNGDRLIMRGVLRNRGRIDGKPVDVYLNPTVVPDPKLKVVEGKYAIGLNLDGKVETGGFVNPATGEAGIDNQLFRAYGCHAELRANPGARPSGNSDLWPFTRPQMRAWLIEISDIDDPQNDSEVTVRFANATSPVTVFAKGTVQPDMTFQADGNPLTETVVKGTIANGVLTTEPMATLNLNGHRWGNWPEIRLTGARLQMRFAADGTVSDGILAGYHKWARIYAVYAEDGFGDRVWNMPGLYYTLRRLADADPDPLLGINTSISVAFTIEVEPAFIERAAAGSAEIARRQDAGETDVPANPPGLTVKTIRMGYGIDVNGGDSNMPPDLTVFADRTGMPLYTADADPEGRSACAGDCLKTWLPVAAGQGAQATGPWRVVTRDDGGRQWAFRGKPVYTYATDVARPQNNGTNQLLKQAGGEGKGHGVDGHRVLEILPEQWMTLPTEMRLREVRAAPGFVLTDARGLPLYRYEPAKRDAATGETGKPGSDWIPVAASQSALPVGDFSTLPGANGRPQWAYRGKPLYRFAGDVDQGDANGTGVAGGFHLVYALRYFMPPGVTIRKSRYYGGLIALPDGTPLYVRETTNGTNVGVVRGDRGKPHLGQDIGLRGCDAECEKRWTPFLAPADAEPSGFWSIYAREDGSRQWAFAGYALYIPADRSLRSTELYDDVSHFEPLPGGRARVLLPMHWRVMPP